MNRRAPIHAAALRAVLAAVLPFLAACGAEEPPSSAAVPPAPEYASVADALAPFLAREMEAKGIPALSVALVDGDRVVWAAGFGEERPGVPASPGTVYRVGSVSKLFTDLAVMRLVEAGELDLDAPVTAYLPDFDPGEGSGGITLRHLMSHRAGLVREPPVGHYFDDAGPTLAATVASLNGTGLVYPPGSRTKYSNAAIAVVGRVLEVRAGRPFARHMAEAVLAPLAMTASAFAPEPAITARLAAAQMWGVDRAPFPAPTFELGMAPAGSMYSTVLDLSRFMSALFRTAAGEEASLVSAETLEEMWTPQFAPEGAARGYGLGFAVGELAGHRQLGHGGAIYGFSTTLSFLPEEGVGVVVASALDGTNAVTDRMADAALRMMLAARAGEPVSPPLETVPVDRARGLELEGLYGADGDVELDWRDDRLVLIPWTGGSPVELRALGDTLVVDGRLGFGTRIVVEGEGIRIGGGGLRPRQADPFVPGAAAPPPAPPRLREVVGEYGWDHNVLYLLERGGRLHALVEWFFLDPLDEVGPDTWAFPSERGLYHGERLVAVRDADGRVTGVEAAGILFPRRAVGTEGGATFRIVPMRPVEELRAEALAATPPEEEGDFRAS
ncbi:MAG TPA: serine hydrolase domain-containing protein, partial [Longimicrobiales bacterium]|nr:serine hydrolase domain-containing protein [Longimicrobiales bacterium]